MACSCRSTASVLDSPNLALADVRDRDRVFQVFEQHRPDVVFHAAALKHLPLLELHPDEAWKTNVVGTHNVLDAAQAVGVSRFVNISTDKAADPTTSSATRSASRAAHLGGRQDHRTPLRLRALRERPRSKGSVLATFQPQVEHGGPITVTHPDVTRFFMTVEEAVR